MISCIVPVLPGIYDGKEATEALLKNSITPIEIIPVNAEKGLVTAFNTGISQSHGEYISILTPDVLVSPNWDIPLLEVLDAYALVQMVSSTTATTDIQQFKAEQDIISTGEDTEFRLWETGVPALYRKSTFDELGLFDDRFNPGWLEDEDMKIRIAAAGWMWGRVVNSLSRYTGEADFGVRETSNRNGTRLKQKWGILADNVYFIDYQETMNTHRVRYTRLNFQNYQKEIAKAESEGKEIGIMKQIGDRNLPQQRTTIVAFGDNDEIEPLVTV